MAGYDYYKKRLEPSIENKIFLSLMYASHITDRVAAVFKQGGEITYASGVDVFKPDEDADWMEAAAEELTKSKDIEALFVVRKIWAFSPNVADEEIDDWTKPIYKHPDSMEVFEAALLTRIYAVEWTVTYTAQGKHLSVDDVYLTREDYRFDDRFLKLEEKEEGRGILEGVVLKQKPEERGKVVGFIGPQKLD